MPQDFSGKILRGRSFKGQNLEGANFSGADIRGADFTGANLRRANFSHATAGLQKRWAILLIFVSLILLILSLFISFFHGYLLQYLFRYNSNNQINLKILSWIVIVLNLAFFYTIVRRGLNATLGLFLGCLVGTSSLSLGLFLLFGFIKFSAKIEIFDIKEFFILLSLGIFFGGFYILGFLIGTLAFNLLLASSGFLVGISILLIAGALSLAITFVEAKVNLWTLIIIVFGISIGSFLVSIYVAFRAISGDEKHVIIRNFTVVIAAFGGTSFRNANLTNADFTGALLKNTDFRKAILTRTCFRKTKKIYLVRPGFTYLQKTQVRQLLVTGQTQDNNFDYQDLRGVNFKGANLADASFIGANLSQANLQDADLTRAKLVQTQLDGTDLTGATLTGAYIEDWNITTDTKFDGVRCEYIYMRLPTPENPEPHRKPDNRQEVFADGEFGDFIKPIFDTLDLYHNQGVDPRAIAISFKQLAENHPEADLRIVGMEVRGEDKFLLRAKTAATADKSELSAEYFDTYNQLKGLPEGEIKLLLAEKDNQIRRLENMVMTALERPSFYSNIQVEEVGTMTNNPGGFSVGGSVGGNVNNVQGDGNRVVQGDTNMTGDRSINTGGGNYNERIERDYIQGNYYAAGQPQSLAEAAAEIQLLLKQLEQTYPTTTTSQQMVVAAEAINRIETNPTLKIRVINAVKEGGLAAFEKAIDNPAGAFIVGAIKGWQEVDAED